MSRTLPAALGTVTLVLFVVSFTSAAPFSAQQVFDAFAFEGSMTGSTHQTLNLRVAFSVGGIGAWRSRLDIKDANGNVVGNEVHFFFLRIQVIQSTGVVFGVWFTRRADGASGWFGQPRVLQELPTGWNVPGTPYYWKLQIEEAGYRIHYTDIETSEVIPHFMYYNPAGMNFCCNYPSNVNIGEAGFKQDSTGGGAAAEFERDGGASFVRDFPCQDPCKSGLDVRWLFYCEVGDDPNLPTYTAVNMPVTCQQAIFHSYQAARFPTCAFPTHLVPNSADQIAIQDLFEDTFQTNWCTHFGGNCAQHPTIPDLWYDPQCPVPTPGSQRRKLETVQDTAPKRRARMRRSSRRTSYTGLKSNEVSGLLADRNTKARHESFLFNHRYLHPVCWELEHIMFTNQNSEHFPALFYWCYDALWCYSEEAVCTDGGAAKLLPRHVYEARINACLGVRGTVWTDLQIKEVLLNNFTNSSFDLNITNGTIYAVAPVPASELEDDGPNFLTRLPLYASLFGSPDCGLNETTGELNYCAFPEALPSFLNYRYKNFEYLRDWIDGVNYNSYLQQRRREYGIPITRFDYVRYCDRFKYTCAPEGGICESRRKWPGYRCRCDTANNYYGDGFFCTKAVETNMAYATFRIPTTVSINASLDKLAEQFENQTGIPREAFDVSSYVDKDLLQNSLNNPVQGEDGKYYVELTIKYPTEDGAAELLVTEGWEKVESAEERVEGLKIALASRVERPGDPMRNTSTFKVDQWVDGPYKDIEVYKRTVDEVTVYTVKYPGPKKANLPDAGTKITLAITDGDSTEEVTFTIEDDTGYAERKAKMGLTATATQGVYLDTPSVDPAEGVEPAEAVAETELPSSEDVVQAEEPEVAAEPAGPATPMLVAGGSVAGVLLLAIVGWSMHKRSSPGEKEAAVMAVHDLGSLQHTTVDVESSHSEDGEAARKAQQGSIKDRWRSGQAGAEDSFTLAQDRSGIWNAGAEEDSRKKRAEDSFKKAQDVSGIWR